MSRRAANPALVRKRTLGAIHVLAHQLGLDDDVYRDLVERVSAEHGPAQRSAGSCTPRQLAAIASELRRRVEKPAEQARNARVWAGKPKGVLSPQLSKVEALLADAGREWAYAHALAKRLCDGVARVEWCDTHQLAKVIAAMQIDADRRGRRARAKAGA